MRWRRVLNGISWITAVPAILLALTHTDVGELLLGALGPPAHVTLGRWLWVAGALAAAAAWRTRTARTAGLVAGVAAAIVVVAVRHRDFTTRDVLFPGSDISIAATIYEPRQPGPHPAVVLVHGSAPLRRGFYALWAEHLAQQGLVVLVPDKRGVGGTGGRFERENNSSLTNLSVLAQDVVAALDHAVTESSVDTTRLGLFGLSQAGWVAPMAALRSPRARFAILLTAPTVSVREEGAWSALRGDDQTAASHSLRDAERIVDTMAAGGVDARSRLRALAIPGLWLFGDGDNSIPSRKSVAVLDSLRAVGKPFQSAVFPRSGHLLVTRDGGLLPHVANGSWEMIRQWLERTIGP